VQVLCKYFGCEKTVKYFGTWNLEITVKYFGTEGVFAKASWILCTGSGHHFDGSVLFVQVMCCMCCSISGLLLQSMHGGAEAEAHIETG
jgi:hypothetical protein